MFLAAGREVRDPHVLDDTRRSILALHLLQQRLGLRIHAHVFERSDMSVPLHVRLAGKHKDLQRLPLLCGSSSADGNRRDGAQRGSDSKAAKQVPKGSMGAVAKISTDTGTAYIGFAGIGEQRVLKANLVNISVLSQADVVQEREKREAAVTLLIAPTRAAGALDVADDEGNTALHLACLHGLCGVAQQLVAAGAGAGLVNNDNKTALLLACAHGHEETARMLVAPTKAAGALDVVGNKAKEEAFTIGAILPLGWTAGVHYQIDTHDRFDVDEICTISRSDGTWRFGKILAVETETEYVVEVDWFSVHEVTSARIIFDSLAAKGLILEIYINHRVAELVISSR